MSRLSRSRQFMGAVIRNTFSWVPEVAATMQRYAVDLHDADEPHYCAPPPMRVLLPTGSVTSNTRSSA